MSLCDRNQNQINHFTSLITLILYSTDAQGVSMVLFRKKQTVGTASTIPPTAIRYPTDAKLPEFFYAGWVGVFDNRWHSVAIVSD